MKSVVIVAALLAGSASNGAAISDSELSLGGVALGDSESHVLAVLGQPSQQSDTGEGFAFEYPGLTVLIGWLEQAAPGKQRHVLQLNATAPNACTPSGVCPGDPMSKALTVYGQPIKAERDSGSFMEYYSNQSTCWLQLGISGHTVHAINAVCQP
ncbi:MAG: hypothetical protein J0I01_16780 [Stenotrophomonas nitritireducens]|uniref:hypothetical protein n=1 Tax=Stenotrophomonas nitritireducens TaxID=83617 RepID=UPI001AC6A28F|nr:hypothetical protein [Stenotrophomonas nitritireducens]MBN8769514.1 hypothetical protein [Stenotrophomonas sp.]MBN8793881.1 hypothetical protein [Stenotrophomonas nitritireducens]